MASDLVLYANITAEDAASRSHNDPHCPRRGKLYADLSILLAFFDHGKIKNQVVTLQIRTDGKARRERKCNHQDFYNGRKRKEEELHGKARGGENGKERC